MIINMSGEFNELPVERMVPLPEKLHRMVKMDTAEKSQSDLPVFHGETGTTYGGRGYSPLVRSLHIPTRTASALRAGLTKEEVGIL